MSKLIITLLCATALLPLCAETSIDLKIKVDNDGVVQNATPKRVYPKYKTERGLLYAYAQAWAKEDYALMYHLLSKDTREEWTYAKLKRLMKKDKAVNGGVKKFTGQKLVAKNGSLHTWSLTLNYKLDTARSSNIRVTLVKVEDKYWYVKDGGLLPPDMSMFDR